VWQICSLSSNLSAVRLGSDVDVVVIVVIVVVIVVVVVVVHFLATCVSFDCAPMASASGSK